MRNSKFASSVTYYQTLVLYTLLFKLRGTGSELSLSPDPFSSMTPLIIGKIASKAKVESLILSHRMLRTLGKEKETKKEIRKSYKGSVKFTNDLSFYKVR